MLRPPNIAEEARARPSGVAREWSALGPPVRPSDEVQGIYEAALVAEAARVGASDGAAARCLVLGATPELRSLAHKHRLELSCVDRDAALFEALEALVAPAGPTRFIHADWLALDEVERFDLVMGDGALNMLPSVSQGRLLERLHRALRPGGLVALRCPTRKPPEHETPAALARWARAQATPFFTATSIQLRMLWLCERQTRHLDHRAFYRYVSGLHDGGVLTAEELAPYRALHLAGQGIDVHYVDQEAFAELAGQRFEVEAVRYAGDYPGSSYNPIFLLRRRG